MARGGSNRLIGVAELAEQLGISEWQLRHEWRKMGLEACRIPGNGALGALKFRERDVVAWMEDLPAAFFACLETWASRHVP